MATHKHEHFLTITLEGESIGSGRVPVPLLLRLLAEMNKALQRTGNVLRGEADSVRRGPARKNIKDEIAFDLVGITHGSPTAVLHLDRSQAQQSFECMDFGLEVIEKALAGLGEIQEKEDDELPVGFDPGVIMAWRDVGTVLEHGVSHICFTLGNRDKPLTVNYTSLGYQRVQKRIQGPQTNIRTIEGRLLMADFKEHGTRCRVHPAMGEPVVCLFDETQKDEVLENILRFVRVAGEAKEDPATGKITSIKIHDIRPLEEREDEDKELLPVGTPLPIDFWQSPSLEQLAASQGTQPLTDPTVLFGTWPGEPDDSFEEDIRKLRQSNMIGADLS